MKKSSNFFLNESTGPAETTFLLHAHSVLIPSSLHPHLILTPPHSIHSIFTSVKMRDVKLIFPV